MLNVYYRPDMAVSTHSRPKAAGHFQINSFINRAVSTHSRPKAAGLMWGRGGIIPSPFQHTAARRRLGLAYLG